MPHLVLTHYTELAEDKGIVLLRGDIVNSGSFSQLEVGACLPACSAVGWVNGSARHAMAGRGNKVRVLNERPRHS
jgi:hypothetical protein